MLTFTFSNALPGRGSEKAFNECPGVSNVFKLSRVCYFGRVEFWSGIELVDSFVQRAITRTITFVPPICYHFKNEYVNVANIVSMQPY